MTLAAVGDLLHTDVWVRSQTRLDGRSPSQGNGGGEGEGEREGAGGVVGARRQGGARFFRPDWPEVFRHLWWQPERAGDYRAGGQGIRRSGQPSGPPQPLAPAPQVPSEVSPVVAFTDAVTVLQQLGPRVAVVDCTGLGEPAYAWLQAVVRNVKRRSGARRALVCLQSIARSSSVETRVRLPVPTAFPFWSEKGGRARWRRVSDD